MIVRIKMGSDHFIVHAEYATIDADTVSTAKGLLDLSIARRQSAVYLKTNDGQITIPSRVIMDAWEAEDDE